MLDSSQWIVKLLAHLLLPSDLAVCTCHCARRTPNFVVSNTEEHISLLLRSGFRSFTFILTNLMLLKSSSIPAGNQHHHPALNSSHRLSEAHGNQPAGFNCTSGWDYHLEDVVPSSLSGEEPQTRPPGPHCPTLRIGREEKPLVPQSQPSSRNSHHRHRQREYLSSNWIHSITGLSLRNIRLLLC